MKRYFKIGNWSARLKDSVVMSNLELPLGGSEFLKLRLAASILNEKLEMNHGYAFVD